MFALLMGTGRAIYGIWGHKFNLKKVMIACGILCAVCYAVASLASNPIVSLVGLAFTGLGVSVMWPGTFSLAAEKFPNGGGVMFGMMAMFGNLGGTMGAMMTGYVSGAAQQSTKVIAYGQANNLSLEQLGLKLGLFTGIIFPIMLVIFVSRFKMKSKSGIEA
jgi:MFS family permease